MIHSHTQNSLSFVLLLSNIRISHVALFDCYCYAAKMNSRHKNVLPGEIYRQSSMSSFVMVKAIFTAFGKHVALSFECVASTQHVLCSKLLTFDFKHLPLHSSNECSYHASHT